MPALIVVGTPKSFHGREVTRWPHFGHFLVPASAVRQSPVTISAKPHGFGRSINAPAEKLRNPAPPRLTAFT
jgi:hypothetical protein